MRALPVRAVVLSAWLLSPAGLRAHDLWLIPPATATVGQPVQVQANSGEDFPTSEHAPDPAAFVKRRLVLPDGTPGVLEAAGKQDKSGLLRFEPAGPGVHLVAVQTSPKLITLAADKFNAYLISDGLPHIYKLRLAEKTLDRPATERYSKSPKALLRAGAGGGDPGKVLGLPLEIVPLHDPFRLKTGATLRVRVLFRDRPLPDANLGWRHPGDGEWPRGTVRTDARGEALVPIGQVGLMTIRLTHMTQPKTAEYEWESFWTSLTFRVPD
jgi:hypothetical protein